jgi:hypothetical protein
MVLQNTLAIGNLAAGGQGVQTERGGDGRGGAIYNAGGRITIANSVLANNQAEAPATWMIAARGGAVYQSNGSLTIIGSSCVGNSAAGDDLIQSFNANPVVIPAPGYGGALYIASGGLTIEQARFLNNTAGGGRVFGIFFSGIAAAAAGQGGAIYSEGAGDIRNSTFSSNVAWGGGDSYSSFSLDGQGGAFYNAGSAVINGDTFDSNLACGSPYGNAFGGAILNASVLTATNCTIAGNRASSGGVTTSCCAAPRSAYGGGVHSAAGVVYLVNVTLASNLVVQGSPVGLVGGAVAVGSNVSSTNSTVTLFNSIVAYGGTNGNCWGVLIDAGYNLSSDGSCNFSSGASFNFTDPKLEPLADNGGSTLTMALDPSSPAIDFGGGIGAPPTDQRGRPRPFGAGVDIGAYEVSPVLPVLQSRLTSAAIELRFAAEATFSYDLQSSADLRTWIVEEAIPAAPTNSVVVRTFPTSVQAKRFFRLRVL